LTSTPTPQPQQQHQHQLELELLYQQQQQEKQTSHDECVATIYSNDSGAHLSDAQSSNNHGETTLLVPPPVIAAPYPPPTSKTPAPSQVATTFSTNTPTPGPLSSSFAAKRELQQTPGITRNTSNMMATNNADPPTDVKIIAL
jgi:hypothetical protein